MAKEVTAIYPGSFDPVTNGHVDIIGRSQGIFDRVIVAVLVNIEKTPFFTTDERLEMLRGADWVVMDEIKAAKLYRELWQSFAVLAPLHTVGVMGDYRTYGNMVAIRAVTSDDAMTADWARLPYDVLARISNRIVNEVPGVNRVVYDVTSKPPGTIEWE